MRMVHQTLGILIFGVGILLAQKLTAQAPGPFPPQIDSRNHFVVWADVERVNFEEYLKWANQTELAPLLQGVRDPEMVAPAKQLLEKLKAAGAKRVYFAGELTALMGDLSAMGMVIRCDQPERCAAALEANPLLPVQFLKPADGAVLLAFSPEGLETLAEVEGEPSANLAKALEGGQDVIGIAAAVPSALVGLFLQSAPNDGSPESKAVRSLLNLKWALISGSPPDSKLSAEAHFNKPEQAAEFAQLINSLTSSMVQAEENLELLTATQDGVKLSNLSAKPIAELAKAARVSAQRAENMNNLKQLAIAMHSFHSATEAFPPQSLTDKAGKRLLSWRVLILPYVDQQELYQQFHLDEAWDSPHNLALLEKMPNLYRSVGNPQEGEAKPGHTRFVAPLTANSIFGKPGLPTRFQKIFDGTSNTILLVHATPAAAVPWTKPDDLVVDAANPLAGLVGEGQNYLLAAFADGSVSSLPPNLDPETIKALLSQDGGEVITPEKLKGHR
jgi:hypothetical protein